MKAQTSGWSSAQAEDLLRQVEDTLKNHRPEHHPLLRQLLIHGGMVAGNYASRPDAKADWRHRSYHHLAFELGEVRTASLKLPKNVRPMATKECYNNAYHLATFSEEYTYVEGYAMTDFLAVNHAWVEDRAGRIIDPTWGGSNLKFGTKKAPSQATYLGVKFSDEYLISRTSETGYHGLFESDWMLACRMLKNGLVLEDGIVVLDGA